jgi:hypothetical protein
MMEILAHVIARLQDEAAPWRRFRGTMGPPGQQAARGR